MRMNKMKLPGIKGGVCTRQKVKAMRIIALHRTIELQWNIGAQNNVTLESIRQHTENFQSRFFNA